jgi:cytosine/uracil/thiamine/allantoin permease
VQNGYDIAIGSILERRFLIVKKSSKFTVFLSVISALAAIAAAIIAATLYVEKKRKDEEELEHYLDCSIQ